MEAIKYYVKGAFVGIADAPAVGERRAGCGAASGTPCWCWG